LTCNQKKKAKKLFQDWNEKRLKAEAFLFLLQDQNQTTVIHSAAAVAVATVAAAVDMAVVATVVPDGNQHIMHFAQDT
jgi:hypothetical protein